MYVIVWMYVFSVHVCCFSGIICNHYPGLVSIGRNRQFISQSIPSIEFLPLCQVPEKSSRNKANEGASEAKDCLIWKRFPIICGNSCLSNGFARCSKRLLIIITHRSVNCFQLSTCGDAFSRQIWFFSLRLYQNINWINLGLVTLSNNFSNHLR